jgi:hypothetical protein
MNAKAIVTPVILVLLLSVLFAGLATVNVAAQGGTLGQAVDNQKLPWSTGGTVTTYTYYAGYYRTQTSSTSGWYNESSTWYSGGSAAESCVYAYTGLHTGVLSDQAYLKTAVNGPGTLGFYWKLNASSSACNLSFYVDGNLRKVLYLNPGALNPPDWTHVTVSIGPGQHTVTWEATALPHAGYMTVVYANVDAVTWTRDLSPRLPLSPSTTLLGR